MARRDRMQEDDDGRTIADMSDVSRPGFWGRPKAARPAPRQEGPASAEEPWREPEPIMTPEERRWYILGALKAALLIGMAFIAGIGLVVLLFLLGAKMA